MRKILFRGKVVRDGPWVYGYYCFMRPNLSQQSKHLIQPFDSCRVGLPLKEVNEKTVGEFTGMRDKHGREIYEGDILKFPEFSIGEEHFPESYGKVIWDDGGWNVAMAEGGTLDVLDTDTAAQAKIAGNIFDNPELMETNCDGE